MPVYIYVVRSGEMQFAVESPDPMATIDIVRAAAERTKTEGWSLCEQMSVFDVTSGRMCLIGGSTEELLKGAGISEWNG